MRTHPRPWLTRLTAVGAATVLLVAGCTSDNNDQGTDGELQRVTYMTGFGDSARENYARVAIEKGFFAEAGLEVSIEIGAGGDTNHTALTSGQVDFATVDSSGAATRYVNGDDTDFQIIAAIHQLWPMALLGYADQGIERARDLNGKTIGLAAGTIAERIFPTWADLAPGVDADTIEVRATNPSTQVQELVAGELDAIALFSVSAPGLELAGGGRDITAIRMADELPDLYGAVVVARKDYVADNPELTDRFIGALMQGMEYMLDNPEEAAQILVEALPEQNPDAAAEEIRQLRDFVYAGLGPDQPLGYIDDARFVQQLGLLQSIGEIEPSGDVNSAMGAPGDPPGELLVNFTHVPGHQEGEQG